MDNENKEDNTMEGGLPAELQFDAQFNNWDDATKQAKTEEYYTANPDKRPAAKPAGEQGAGNGGAPAGETAEAKAIREAAEKGGGAPAATGAIDYSKYGEDVKSDDDLAALVKKAREYDQKVAELADLDKSIRQQEQILSKAKNPVPEHLRPAVKFYEATGIKNSSVIDNVMSVNKDTVTSDPVKVLTAATLIENPEFAERGWDKTYKNVCREKNIDPETPFAELSEDQQDSLIFAATKALKTVEEKTEKVANSEDFFESLSKNHEVTSAKAIENAKTWQPTLTKIAAEFKGEYVIKYKDDVLGEIDVPVVIGEGIVNQTLKGFSSYLGQNPADEKGESIMREAVLRNAIGSDGLQKTLAKFCESVKEKMQPIADEIALKKLHNGGAINLPKGSKVKSEATFEDYLNSKTG